MEQMVELGFYGLAGHSDSPRDLVEQSRRAEELGLGSAFLSERFNFKDAAVLSGVVGASTETLGIATGATNHNTRHPLVTATFASTMHGLTDGRFALGLGRGFDFMFDIMGLPHVTSAQLEDVVGLLRRLWRGEHVAGHDGPAGRYPYLFQDPAVGEEIPVMLCALGTRTLEFAGRVFDGVILHTFFSDDALANSVDAVRRGAEQAGRDPRSVRVWSVLATVGDHIPRDARMKKLVGRLATYLQAYGGLIVEANGWDPAVLERFRADEKVQAARGAIDATATIEELEHYARLIPDEWLAASATGTPEQCAARINDQFHHGADGVILHGATPEELAPVLDAYREVRSAGRFVGRVANPAR
jgi:probable F420-dependent oxidoreductase